MKLRAVRLSGFGKYLPPRVVTSAELEVRLSLPAGWIADHTGVEERRYADESQSGMAAKAVREAMQDAGLTWSDVSLLIGACGVPEQAIPCTAALVQKQLGEAAFGVGCFDVNTTCLSFLAALDVASALVDSGAHRHIVVFSAEKASIGLNPHEPESATLMGDGAAAVVVSRATDGESSVMAPAALTTFSAGSHLAEVRSGGTAHHPSDPATTREMMLFHMEGPKIMRFTQKAGVPFIRRYVDALPWPDDTIRLVVPHQASLFAMRLMARAVGFEGRLFENIRDHGNCVAASIPMALHDAVKSGRLARGDVTLLGGTAAGVSIGVLALRL